jgi:isopentenyl diphosphate isomerase/L-lactate dehydrogenase-like FMN-dependent dehydrogenase
MGRRRKGGDSPLAAVVARPLTAEDVQSLGTERGTKPVPVRELRARHHQLARSIAAGLTAVEIAAITGYSTSRISIMQSDPAFQDLVAHYRGLDEAAFVAAQADANVMAVTVKTQALEELSNRLEDAPEELTPGQLLEVAKAMMDRTGQGVATATTNLNINIGLADRVKAARERVMGRLVDVTPAKP